MATAGDKRGPGPERAFADPLPDAGAVTLGDAESAHLVRSRRVREGDAVVLFDGKGGSVLGRLTVADAKAAVIEVEGPYPDREPARVVRIAVSLPESGRADGMVATLAELGVTTLRPLRCARTPPKRAQPSANRIGRWQRIVREAAKVNGRSRLMDVLPARALDELLAADPCVLLDPDPDAQPLASVLPRQSDVPWLLVGPEGGFTEDEMRAAAQAGAATARLGRTALRTDTAAVAAASIALACSVN